ncbi:CaiB/BaiF CoA transferase family protein [Inhella sp.]|uniref:CaiB/BaiF CoA transferase family protein n=1 Tax=Inhella sp. TaxID=1921806 RepID=UPI0035B3B641
MATPMALQGIRVLDLSRVLAGPWATQMLGDLGAEIIKVEKPGSGDDTRHWGPPFDPTSGDAAYFQCANRNKRSLALDFAQPEGAALLRELAGQCDVVVENFKPGSLARHGLSPEQLLAAHPRLVVCSISGFGHSGPLRERAGYDFVVQALGGLMSITGAPDGEPQKVGVAVTDLFTGLHAAVAILAALRHVDATGEGQHIDLALFDCQLAMLANQASQYLSGGPEPRRMGNAHPAIAPYETLACQDGELVLAVGNDSQFARLAALLGAPELAGDARFARNADRLAHRAQLREALEQRLRTQPRTHWQVLCDAAGVPATAVQSVAEALQHPQALARGMLEALHPGQDAQAAGTRLAVASPLKLSRTPVRTRSAPPLLGAQGPQLLAEFGVNEARIQRLMASGVLGRPPGLGMDEGGGG